MPACERTESPRPFPPWRFRGKPEVPVLWKKTHSTLHDSSTQRYEAVHRPHTVTRCLPTNSEQYNDKMICAIPDHHRFVFGIRPGNSGTLTDIDILGEIRQIPCMARLVVPGLPHHITQRGTGGNASLARPWPHRPPAGQRHVCPALGASRRSPAPPQKTRPTGQITQTAKLRTCPGNSRNSRLLCEQTC